MEDNKSKLLIGLGGVGSSLNRRFQRINIDRKESIKFIFEEDRKELQDLLETLLEMEDSNNDNN